jgi:hypothetical protein
MTGSPIDHPRWASLIVRLPRPVYPHDQARLLSSFLE